MQQHSSCCCCCFCFCSSCSICEGKIFKLLLEDPPADAAALLLSTYCATCTALSLHRLKESLDAALQDRDKPKAGGDKTVRFAFDPDSPADKTLRLLEMLMHGEKVIGQNGEEQKYPERE